MDVPLLGSALGTERIDVRPVVGFSEGKKRVRAYWCTRQPRIVEFWNIEALGALSVLRREKDS